MPLGPGWSGGFVQRVRDGGEHGISSEGLTHCNSGTGASISPAPRRWRAEAALGVAGPRL